MLDQQIAGLAAGHDAHGLGDALYHQLARRLDATAASPKPEGK
jgi:Rod binding domain-containing protein